MDSKLNSLPAELKQEVFSTLGVKKSHLCSYTLVCNSWKTYFEEKLYQRILIHNFAQLIKLLETMEANEHIRNLIKRVTIKFEKNSSDSKESAFIGRFFMVLPNVEYIKCTSGSYYKFISDALSRDQLSQLNYLIPPTTDKDMDDYIDCAIMLRDRLKTLKMSERTYIEPLQQVISVENPVRFNRLYNVFNEFKFLNRLRIGKRRDNIIDLIEQVSVNCPLLNILFLDVAPIEADNIIEIDDMSRFVPVNNITHLTIRTGVLQQSRNILYMIQKFPCLVQLKTIGQEQKTLNVNRYTLEKWMKFIKDIKHTDLKYIPCVEKDAAKLLGPFWKSIDKKCLVLVTCCYSDSTRVWDAMDLSVTPTECNTKLFYFTLQHPKLIKDHGHIIRALKLEGVNSTLLNTLQSPEELSLYQITILQPLKYCPRLRKLLIVACTIDSLDAVSTSDTVTTRKKSFSNLAIADCTVESNEVLTSIYKLFHRIEFLQLYRIRFISDPEDDAASLNDIDLEETDIGTLSLSKIPILDNDPKLESFILVKITTQEMIRYYAYSHDLMRNDSLFKPCSEEIYNTAKKHQDEHKSKICLIIGISCKSIKKLEVIHRQSSITCTIV